MLLVQCVFIMDWCEEMEKLKIDQKELMIFCLSILLHALVMGIAFLAYRAQNPDAGYALIWERMTTAGDAPHYLFLAEEGYQSFGEKENLIVFYPLYPVMIRILANCFLFQNYELAGIIISQISTGAAAVFLYKLLRLDYNEEPSAEAVFLFLTYPFMMFTMGVFTEGIFLALTIAALYFIRKHAWVKVGILGMMASLCRMQGILLLVPAGYELIVMLAGKRSDWKKFLNKRQWMLTIMPVGFLAYLMLNFIKQGDCFSFMKHQSAPPWYQSIQWINANLTKDYGMAMEYRELGYFIYWVQILLFFIAIFALLYGIHKKVRSSVIVYGGIYTCFCYLSGWLISGARYMLGCVPLFIVYAAIENKMARKIILAINAALCMLYTILFLQGQAIM